MAENLCQGCTACCNIMRVEGFTDAPDKPARTPCTFCVKGGCGIYLEPTKPDNCSGFQCVWLVSQERPALAMASALRPDRCNVVLEVNSMGTIIAHSKTEFAWKEPRILKWLCNMARKSPVTIDLPGERVLFLNPDGRTEELEYLDTEKGTNLRRYIRRTRFKKINA